MATTRSRTERPLAISRPYRSRIQPTIPVKSSTACSWAVAGESPVQGRGGHPDQILDGRVGGQDLRRLAGDGGRVVGQECPEGLGHEVAVEAVLASEAVAGAAAAPDAVGDGEADLRPFGDLGEADVTDPGA